jgi:hypothetical protein
MVLAYYHWFFVAVPHGVPERMLAAGPAFWADIPGAMCKVVIQDALSPT